MNNTDFEKLSRSYITPEIIGAAQIRRVDSQEGAELVGRKPRAKANYAGLCFPYFWPGEPKPREWRLRRDQPDLEKQSDGLVKEKNKYLSAPGRGNLLYFLPTMDPAWLENPSIPCTITEGEKKALALTRFYADRQEQRLVVGLSGVWNWRGKIEVKRDVGGHTIEEIHGVIPDIERIVWKDRPVLIVFDANVKTNQSVKAARAGLMRALRERGADVTWIDLPDVEGVNGIDDLLAAKGADFVAGIFETAGKSEAKKGKQQKSQVGGVTFNNTDSGVWATDEDGDKTWVCSELAIEADTRDDRSENWGRLLRFPDRDGVWHQWAMPMELLGGDGQEVRRELLRQGVRIGNTQKARRFLEAYLNADPGKRVLCVTKQGWHRGSFVLPDEAIGGEDAEPVYLQSFSTDCLFRSRGTADEWRNNVGRYCVGNSRLLLAVSVAFSAVLVDPLHGESGGWHFTGSSSLGKSTALFVAGSVHGGGGDKGFLRRWRATINGLESVAEAHNDGLLCLDEIAECKPDDVNESAYMLANGQGKTRQSRTGGMRRTMEWRLTLLSSGEISLADHIAQTGKRIRAGQEVRVINLPAKASDKFGLFEELHDFQSGDDFSRYLQRASRDCYGAPIRAFLSRIVGGLDSLSKRYRTFEAELLAEMLPEKVSSEVGRVAHRFALAAFAGELATEMELTGWQPDDATNAIKTMLTAWLNERGTTGSADEEAALRQVKRFFELHGQSRFQRIGLQGENTYNRAGYVEPADEADAESGLVYYVLPEVFRADVCTGFDLKMVLRALDQRGALRVTVTRGFQCEKRLPEGRKKVYGVLSKLLED